MCANPAVEKDRAVFKERDSGRERTGHGVSVALHQDSPADPPSILSSPGTPSSLGTAPETVLTPS